MIIAKEHPQPVHLEGWLEDEPLFTGEDSESEEDLAFDQEIRFPLSPNRPRTIMIVQASKYYSAARPLPISGTFRLEMEGFREDLHIGDRIEVWGRLLKPRPALSPDDFDYSSYLRSMGIGSIIRCRVPDEIRLIARYQSWSFHRFLEEQQAASIEMLESLVGPDQGPLATALFLGPRNQLPNPLRLAFSRSGAAHLLAISGINVAILALFVWFWGRLLNFRFQVIQWGMLLIVIAYLGLTDANPPLVRAALLLGFSGFGQLSRRSSDAINGLSLAGSIVLIWNPRALFDIGAQLSFLAVLGLITCERFYQLWQTSREQELIERLEDLLPWRERALRKFGKQVAKLYLYTIAIWIFTQPLVLARFQLFPSLGFFVNVLATPLVTFVLFLGYFVLLLGKIPFVAACGLLNLPGAMLRWGLQLMEQGVWFVSGVPGGHAYVPGPHVWWLCGYHVLLILLSVIPWQLQCWRWILRGWWTWWLIGFAVLLLPSFDTETRCTVLPVGHGGAVLLEFPAGQTMLYDCGAMGNPELVAETVQSALSRRGKKRIDLVVLSHADADHFNGTVDLMSRVQVRGIAVARSFLKLENRGIRELIDSSYQRSTPIQLIRAGDELRVDQQTRIQCLHPVEGHEASTDNANSIVLSVEIGERKILLTGDLDQEGLQDFLKRPRGHYDMLMAPHHGGRTANPPELGAWASPNFVSISGGQPRFIGRLAEVYPNASAIFWTPFHGEISTTIDQRGVFECKPFRSGSLSEAIEGSDSSVP